MYHYNLGCRRRVNPPRLLYSRFSYSCRFSCWHKSKRPKDGAGGSFCQVKKDSYSEIVIRLWKKYLCDCLSRESIEVRLYSFVSTRPLFQRFRHNTGEQSRLCLSTPAPRICREISSKFFSADSIIPLKSLRPLWCVSALFLLHFFVDFSARFLLRTARNVSPSKSLNITLSP